MYYEIEGRYNMKSLIFDEDCLMVGDKRYPYDEIDKMEVTSAPLFSTYGIMTLVVDGKKIPVPFPRFSAEKIRRAIRELERERNHPESQEKKSTAQADPYEEMKKLKELLDLGIITEEEFQKKKEDILGLQ